MLVFSCDQDLTMTRTDSAVDLPLPNSSSSPPSSLSPHPSIPPSSHLCLPSSHSLPPLPPSLPLKHSASLVSLLLEPWTPIASPTFAARYFTGAILWLHTGGPSSTPQQWLYVCVCVRERAHVCGRVCLLIIYMGAFVYLCEEF